MKKENMKRVSVQLPEEMFEVLDEIAKNESTSMSSIIRRYVINELKQSNKKDLDALQQEHNRRIEISEIIKELRPVDFPSLSIELITEFRSYVFKSIKTKEPNEKCFLPSEKRPLLWTSYFKAHEELFKEAKLFISKKALNEDEEAVFTWL